jgi:hypothetical protein
VARPGAPVVRPFIIIDGRCWWMAGIIGSDDAGARAIAYGRPSPRTAVKEIQ